MYGDFTAKAFISSDSHIKDYLLLFIVWPFIAFITALANYRNKEARIVVYMFLIYYGLTYFQGAAGMDSGTYIRNFQYNATLPFSDFIKIVGGLYTSETSVDIIEPLISFIISRFTDDFRLLFASYAALFGYFYLKSIDLIYDRYKENPSWDALIYMVFFIAVISIHNINGFRMWTAAWVFFYGAYHVVLHRRYNFLILALSASLIHWSFITANFVLFLYLLIGNRNLIYVPLALSSFILPGLLTSFFSTVSMRMGGSIQGRYDAYNSEEYILSNQEMLEQTKPFLTLSKDLIFYYLIFVLVLVGILYKDLMKEKDEKNLFSFLILFLAFVNFGRTIPSFGERFQILFILFATFYIFIFFLKSPKVKLNILLIIGLLPMALYSAVEFRIASEVINSWIFLPGLGLPLVVPGISLAELLFY